jgi:Nif-specific regulatory protein
MPFSEPTSANEGQALGIVGACPAMQEVYRLIRLVAPTKVTVLVVGETGTGKELVARGVHRLSSCKDGPYIRVNCGALNENLLESELFGHVKGAFTGAIDNKTGRFEAATGGTIFLDEISSMSPKLQVKLLRVLQENEFERVGDSKTIRVDVRVVAATNQFLEDEIEAGRFRDDLYYRLNVVPIDLPPLRERREDIPALANYFLERHSLSNKRPQPELTPAFLKVLTAYDWPGNVREMENYLARAVVLSEGKPLTTELVAPPGQIKRRWRPLKPRANSGGDLDGLIRQLVHQGIETFGNVMLDKEIVGRVERELINQVMADCQDNQSKAAERLGINRNTLHKKVNEYKQHNGLPDGETVE